MAYNTPETVADYLARFQMEITHRGKGTFTPDHEKDAPEKDDRDAQPPVDTDNR